MGSMPGPGFKLSLMPQEEGKKTNFGAIVEGVDLNNISGQPLSRISLQGEETCVSADMDVQMPMSRP